MAESDDLFVSTLGGGQDADLILNAVLGQSPAGVVAVDPQGRVLMINRAAREMFERRGDLREGMTWEDLCAGSELRSPDRSRLTSESDPLSIAQREIRSIAKRVQLVAMDTRQERWVSVTAFPVLNKEGKHIASVATFLDITDFKGMHDALYYRATHDSLTGLSNRALFSASLAKALARAKRNNVGGAIMVIDLDNFKEVNDTLGHAVGDELLVKVADRLAREVRETDVASRIGGDEFSVLLQDIEGEDNVSTTEQIARRVCSALTRPFSIWRRSVRITSSIGISLFPEHGIDEETLLARADMAMYQVKRQGKNGWKLWEGPVAESGDIASCENTS